MLAFSPVVCGVTVLEGFLEFEFSGAILSENCLEHVEAVSSEDISL